MDNPYVYHKEYGVGVILEEKEKYKTPMCLVSFSEPDLEIWIASSQLQVLEQNNERI